MKIYLDVLIITNAVITIVYIKCISKITHYDVSRLRAGISSIIGGVASLLVIAQSDSFIKSALIAIIKIAVSCYVTHGWGGAAQTYERAKKKGGGVILGGANYGQGSSREHAALVPLYLGIKAVVAKSFARIHVANLINFGIVPMTLKNPDDYEKFVRLTS